MLYVISADQRAALIRASLVGRVDNTKDRDHIRDVGILLFGPSRDAVPEPDDPKWIEEGYPDSASRYLELVATHEGKQND